MEIDRKFWSQDKTRIWEIVLLNIDQIQKKSNQMLVFMTKKIVKQIKQ